jgi:hypothetical protein
MVRRPPWAAGSRRAVRRLQREKAEVEGRQRASWAWVLRSKGVRVALRFDRPGSWRGLGCGGASAMGVGCRAAFAGLDMVWRRGYVVAAG